MFRIMKQETIPDSYILSLQRKWCFIYFLKYITAVRPSDSFLLWVRICSMCFNVFRREAPICKEITLCHDWAYRNYFSEKNRGNYRTTKRIYVFWIKPKEGVTCGCPIRTEDFIVNLYKPTCSAFQNHANYYSSLSKFYSLCPKYIALTSEILKHFLYQKILFI